MPKKEMPEFLKQKAEEVIEKRVFDLTGQKSAQLDTIEERRKLGRLSRRKSMWTNFMFIAWLIAAFSLFVYSNMSKLPHPDVIRSQGVFHEGTVIKQHFPKAGCSSTTSKMQGCSSFVEVMLDDGQSIKEIVTPEILEKLKLDQKIKVWKYDERFWIDEEGNLAYHDPLPLLIIGLVFLLLGVFCFLKRRNKITL